MIDPTRIRAAGLGGCCRSRYQSDPTDQLTNFLPSFLPRFSSLFLFCCPFISSQPDWPPPSTTESHFLPSFLLYSHLHWRQPFGKTHPKGHVSVLNTSPIDKFYNPGPLFPNHIGINFRCPDLLTGFQKLSTELTGVDVMLLTKLAWTDVIIRLGLMLCSLSWRSIMQVSYHSHVKCWHRLSDSDKWWQILRRMANAKPCWCCQGVWCS